MSAVGGTSLAVGATDNYLFETGWGTARTVVQNGDWSPAPPGPFINGGGGGTSRLFSQPLYQQGVVPDSISNFLRHRQGAGGPGCCGGRRPEYGNAGWPDPDVP